MCRQATSDVPRSGIAKREIGGAASKQGSSITHTGDLGQIAYCASIDNDN
jgi:hypothetical protein